MEGATMSLAEEIIRKTPWEVTPFDFDLTSLLAPGETIESSPVAISPTGGAHLAVVSVAANGAIIQGTYSGGVAGTEYTVRCSVTTSARKIEICGYLHVVDC